jgi:hypothetical protein
MKLLLKIDMDNAAFEPAGELEAARILEVAAKSLRDGADSGNLFDCNGNKVGKFRVLEGKESKRAETKEFADFLDKLLHS